MNKPFEIGRLRHRLEWMRQVDVPRIPGRQDQTVMVSQGIVWAAIDPLRGAELFEASQLKLDISFKLTLRNRPFRAGDHLVLQGASPRTFVIQTINRLDELNEFVVATASERLA